MEYDRLQYNINNDADMFYECNSSIKNKQIIKYFDIEYNVIDALDCI
jgi:hypothetical protein